MSWRHSKAAGELPLREPTQKAVLLALAHHANEYTGQCWPSVERLALFTGLSRRAVQQALRDLQAGQLVAIVERAGRPNTYTLQVGEKPVDQSGRDAAQASQGGAGGAPPGAGGAPEQSGTAKDSLKKDARASFSEHWKPSKETVDWVKQQCGLDEDTIAAELEVFVLRNLANEVEVKNPDAAFRLWCRRRDGLAHPPPAPRRSKAKAPADPISERERIERRYRDFKAKGESCVIGDPMRARFLGWAEDERLKLAQLPPPLFEEKPSEEAGRQ